MMTCYEALSWSLTAFSIIFAAATFFMALQIFSELAVLKKEKEELSKKCMVMEEIKEILILQCCLSSDDGMICGREAVELIKQKYPGIDDLTALKFLHSTNEEK